MSSLWWGAFQTLIILVATGSLDEVSTSFTGVLEDMRTLRWTSSRCLAFIYELALSALPDMLSAESPQLDKPFQHARKHITRM